MKAVGEAMSLGRNFSEALGKAMRSIDKGGSVFHWEGEPGDVDELLTLAARPTEQRLVQVQQALRAGATVEQVFEATKIDPWFVDQIQLVNEVAQSVADAPALTAEVLRAAKRHGLSDHEHDQPRGHNAHALAVALREARGAGSYDPYGHGYPGQGHQRTG